VTETTIENNNKTLWNYVVPEGSLLYWVRNWISNRLATKGTEWMSIFSQFNSGTYNNEWMIVDYKLFQPGSPLQPGTFSVLDQMPGPYLQSADMTDWLQKEGYFASYNVPFFEEIFNVSNQWALVREYGDAFSWSKASRGQIFSRLHGNVTDEESLKRVIRYNDFQEDPVGMQGCQNPPGSASNAIAERGDLTPLSSLCIPWTRQTDEAAIDAKYTTSEIMQQLVSSPLGAPLRSTVAQSGPTYDTQPVFEWSASPFANLSHIGMPDRWQFDWVDVVWGNQ